MTRTRHPKITPLRAFELLLRVEHRIGRLEDDAQRNPTVHLLRDVRDALASHVRAGLVRGRR
jgi:hypothetical protein